MYKYLVVEQIWGGFIRVLGEFNTMDEAKKEDLKYGHLHTNIEMLTEKEIFDLRMRGILQ